MDSFFGIGIAELFFIAVIALIVLGPERLPGALREVAKVIRTVRAMTNELMGQFGDEMKVFDDLNPQKLLRELTDDPAEKTKATAAKPAKPATKPAAKPATSSTAKSTTTKPTTTKPAATKPATPPKPATPKVASSAATSKPEPTTDAQPVEGETIVAGVGEVANSDVISAEGASVETSSGEPGVLGTVALSGVATGAEEDAPAVVVDEPNEQSILPPDRLAQVETQPAETQVENTQVENIDTGSVEMVQVDPAEDAPDPVEVSAVEDSVTDTALVPSETVATSEVEEPEVESGSELVQESPPDVVSESPSEVVVETAQASVNVNGLNKHSASKNGASAEGDA